MVVAKPQAVKLKPETVQALKDLSVEVSGVNLDTYELKVQHLIWFYSHYKNNNGKASN